jgi:hypothetical protein
MYVVNSHENLREKKKTVTDLIKKAYKYTLTVLLVKEKNWVPHISCLMCATAVTEWVKGNCCAMPFGIPMVWREPKDHFSDYYFCLTNTAGHSSTTKHTIRYPDVSSALNPMPHGLGLPVPQPYLETTESGPSQESEPEDAQPSEEYLPECQRVHF